MYIIIFSDIRTYLQITNLILVYFLQEFFLSNIPVTRNTAVTTWPMKKMDFQ